jgi:hypothetical protein
LGQSPSGASAGIRAPHCGQSLVSVIGNLLCWGFLSITRASGEKGFKKLRKGCEHSPQDELKPDWDFSGFVVLARFTLDAVREIANADQMPIWIPGDEFRPAREKHGVK